MSQHRTQGLHPDHDSRFCDGYSLTSDQSSSSPLHVVEQGPFTSSDETEEPRVRGMWGMSSAASLKVTVWSSGDRDP